MIDEFRELPIAEQSVLLDWLHKAHIESQFGKPVHPQDSTHVQLPLPFIYCEKWIESRNDNT